MIYTNGKDQISLPYGTKDVNRYLGNDLIKKYNLTV